MPAKTRKTTKKAKGAPASSAAPKTYRRGDGAEFPLDELTQRLERGRWTIRNALGQFVNDAREPFPHIRRA